MLKFLPEVMLHVGLLGFAIQGVFGLNGRKCMGCIPECALSMLDLIFSQSQIRNATDYHF